MKRRIAILILASFSMFACSKEETKKSTESKATATENANASTDEGAGGGAQSKVRLSAREDATTAESTPRVKFKTNKGDFVIELNRGKAPISVANFLGYVNKKHYDGTVFHRVMDSFMIQGGGFTLEAGALVEKPTGKGIKNEAKNGLKNDIGTVAMARTNDPDSATAQFFVNVVNNDNLNSPQPDGHGYAVFGKVIEGMDVINKIRVTPTGMKPLTMRHPATGDKITQPSSDVPTENIIIESATLVK